ncbi:MAG: hypothetical protein NZ903_01265 [Candidatus Micrarchaeota archaeon]|nr:hypothetical protein [Candidatus Micrarchaeota archaeon]
MQDYNDIDNIKNKIKRMKEMALKEISETNRLLRKAGMIEKIMERMKMTCSSHVDDSYQNIVQLINKLKEEDINEKKTAISELTLIAKETKDKGKLRMIYKCFIDAMKEDDALSEDILSCFYEIAIINGYTEPIVWASKFHTSERIRTDAQIILEEISKTIKQIESDKWKKSFKAKIYRQIEREKRLYKFKNKEQIMESEEILNLKKKFASLLSNFVSINAAGEYERIDEKLFNLIDNKIVIKLYYIMKNGQNKLDIYNLYAVSVKIAVMFLENENLEGKKEEINSLLLKAFKS